MVWKNQSEKITCYALPGPYRNPAVIVGQVMKITQSERCISLDMTIYGHNGSSVPEPPLYH